MILRSGFFLLALLYIYAGNVLAEDDPSLTPATRTVLIKAPATDGSITLTEHDPTVKVIFKTKGWYCSEHPVLASHMPNNQLRIRQMMELPPLHERTIKEWEKVNPDHLFTDGKGHSIFIHDPKAGMFWVDAPLPGGTNSHVLSTSCYTKEDLEFFKKFLLIEYEKFE